MFREGGPNQEQIGESPELDNKSPIHKGAANEQPSNALSCEFEEPLDLSIILPENQPIDFAIASYLREKGPQALLAAYKNMSEDARQGLKRFIAEGDLETVINAVEMNDPMNIKAQKTMHVKSEDNEDFVRTLEKGTFVLLDRNRGLASKHRARAREWQETGIAPDIEEGLPGSAEDAPAVRRKLAEMPLDIRDYLERIPPRIRQSVIGDDELLNVSMEKLIEEFPQLSRRIAREFIMQRGRKEK